MIRWILFAILLVMWRPSSTVEFQHHLEDWQNEALLHLGYGNIHLLSGEPWQALECFQKAFSVLDESDESSCSIGFLITFSQVIAYDCLGFRDQCRQSIGSLFLAINKFDEPSEEEYAELKDNEFVLKETEDDKVMIQFLKDLVNLSPSFEVKELLFSLIDDIAEEMLPSFEFAGPLSFKSMQFGFDNGWDDFSVVTAKSFWKRLRKWTKEVGDWMRDLLKVIKGANEVKKAYNELKKKDEGNVNFEECKRYYDNRFNNPLEQR